MLQEYVWNQGNGWQVTIEELGRYFERVQGLTLPDVASDQPQAWIDRRTISGRQHPVSIGRSLGLWLTVHASCQNVLNAVSTGALQSRMLYVLSDGYFEKLLAKKDSTIACSIIDQFNLCWKWME
jgi:hypothetical protein